jgi:hypothetical protein
MTTSTNLSTRRQHTMPSIKFVHKHLDILKQETSLPKTPYPMEQTDYFKKSIQQPTTTSSSLWLSGKCRIVLFIVGLMMTLMTILLGRIFVRWCDQV